MLLRPCLCRGIYDVKPDRMTEADYEIWASCPVSGSDALWLELMRRMRCNETGYADWNDMVYYGTNASNT